MLYKFKEKRLMLFASVLSEIQCVNNNHFIVRNVRKNTQESFRAIEMTGKISPACMEVSSPEEFGFQLLAHDQIKHFFSDYKETFPSPSLYYMDENNVFLVQHGMCTTILYNELMSHEVQYIDEFQDIYLKMCGRELIFTPTDIIW
ncbi:hypothetical protein [Chryseobacterium sp. MEBOG07]|uniref:hypothetical protein n=1 Tax=Chryseobacterium sp. MEBOG07 TaxID=2879939 RepID=UPI001F354F63|nr:hypothetical protein [Chryseobacterium sp. MEBOG07]UKB78613.1 hypothetical protein LF886_19420 [Chryseobacterium sp. MEBOG07]